MTPADPGNRTRLVVGDQTPVYRHGVECLLRGEYDVFTAGTVTELRDLLARGPAAALVDLRMLRADADLAEAVYASGAALLITVTREQADTVLDLVEQGVHGLWDREAEPADLRRVVAGVLAGTPEISSDVGAALLKRIASASAAMRETTGQLTAREMEVLQLVAEGRRNRDIAGALYLSENTVRNHVRSILDKLHAASRTEAVARAHRIGLIRLG